MKKETNYNFKMGLKCQYYGISVVNYEITINQNFMFPNLDQSLPN
jgi:hypothetical protein